jgi:hypothetical protein
MEIELFLHIQPPLLDNILAHGPPALPLWNPITTLLAAILREFPRWNMQLYFTPLDPFYRWQLDRQQECEYLLSSSTLLPFSTPFHMRRFYDPLRILL